MLWAARSAGGFAKACTRIALHVVCCAIELGVALILCLAGRRWLVLHALLGIASIESEMANAKDVGLLTDVFCCLRRGPPFCVHGILGAWCEARLAFPQGGRKRDPASDSSFRGICLWVRRFSHLPSVVVVCVCVCVVLCPLAQVVASIAVGGGEKPVLWIHRVCSALLLGGRPANSRGNARPHQRTQPTQPGIAARQRA